MTSTYVLLAPGKSAPHRNVGAGSALCGTEPSRHAPFSPSAQAISLVGFEDDGRVAAALIDGNPGSTLVFADPDFRELDPVARFDGLVTDYVPFGNFVFVSSNWQTLFRRPADAAPDAFAEVEGPVRCLVPLPGEQRLIGCGLPFQGGHFLISEDGESWQAAIPLADVRDRRCPEQSAGHDACAYLFKEEVVPAGIDAGIREDEDNRRTAALACACTLVSGRRGSLRGLLLVTVLGIFAAATWRRPREHLGGNS